jgi:hypothetical protein
MDLDESAQRPVDVHIKDEFVGFGNETHKRNIQDPQAGTPRDPSPPLSEWTEQSPPVLPASNFISVHKKNKSIKGTWVIDTNLRDPEALVAPRERHNLEHHTSNARCVFSRDMQEHLESISSDCSFLGPWESSGFDNYEEWKGDKLDASISNGRIKFFYDGEDLAW